MSELRVDVGAGYRVYFTRRQRIVIVLPCGGDKSTQKNDTVLKVLHGLGFKLNVTT